MPANHLPLLLRMLPEKWRSKKMRAAAIELCEAGLLTCTSGEPGGPDATYALAWEPLHNPADFPAEVRAKHTRNMTALKRRPSEGKS